MNGSTNGVVVVDNQESLEPVRAPARWRKFLAEMMELERREPGRRWQVVVTPDARMFDWSVTDLGKVRRP